jgi:maltose alpha-D-glucosyltransferase/alpha-amylase
MFLRNHDELTLEMVTDEERDYMYRAYASERQARINLGIRRRLAPLLGSNRRRIELMNGLLLSLPGTPVLYYGDEIGMGDNIYLGDRNGVRTPMQWSADRNAGFSRANPQRLYLPIIIDPEYHYEAVNVEAQQNNPSSLLWWTKRLIGLRKRYKAFGRGTLEFLQPSNRKILAFLRRHEHATILVVANLSRFVEFVELDLSAFQGQAPVELFSRSPFPPVGRQPYLLTMGPHSFYWFALETRHAEAGGAPEARPAAPPELTVRGGWEDLFRGPAKGRLEDLLPAYIHRQPWLNGDRRTVKSVTLREMFRLRYGEATALIALADTELDAGEPQTFVLPLTLFRGEAAERLLHEWPALALARLRGGAEGILGDALADRAFCAALLEAVAAGKSYRVGAGELVAWSEPALAELRPTTEAALHPTLGRAPQTNTSVIYGNRLILKAFRRAQEGINPDLETCRFLGARGTFPHVPALLGAIEYRARRGEPITLGLLQTFVPNEGPAWQITLDELSRFFERVLALPAPNQVPALTGSVLDLGGEPVPGPARELVHSYLEWAQLLGQRTAEMHLTLTSDPEDPAFAPEPFGTLYQRSMYQSLRNLKRRAFERLRDALDELPEPARAEAARLLGADEALHQRLRAVMGRKFHAQRTRIHGDYHLAHVLYTGKDFVIIDFEGEADRSIAERRLKRSPLRDVASMIRSFHYAALVTLFGHGTGRGHVPGWIRPEDVPVLEPWARLWHSWVSAAFVWSYLARLGNSDLVPRDPAELRQLFDVLLLEKALHELSGELTRRLDLVRIPLLGILQILESGT